MGEQAAWDPTQANAKMVEYEERYFESVLVDELFYLSNKRMMLTLLEKLTNRQL